MSDQSTRCDEAEHQAVVDEANPCFSFCDLTNSPISSSCASKSYFRHSSTLECGGNQLRNRFHICLYPISNWFKNWNKCLMHISSTAVPKDVVEKKEKIAEIHLDKHRRKEK